MKKRGGLKASNSTNVVELFPDATRQGRMFRRSVSIALRSPKKLTDPDPRKTREKIWRTESAVREAKAILAKLPASDKGRLLKLLDMPYVADVVQLSRRNRRRRYLDGSE